MTSDSIKLFFGVLSIDHMSTWHGQTENNLAKPVVEIAGVFTFENGQVTSFKEF
jgi:hypothetical protein